jgi:hypothetical protein
MDVNFTPSPDIDQEILGRMFPTNGHHSGGDSGDRDCGDAGDGDDGGGGDHRRRVLTAASKIKPRRVQ